MPSKAAQKWTSVPEKPPMQKLSLQVTPLTKRVIFCKWNCNFVCFAGEVDLGKNAKHHQRRKQMVNVALADINARATSASMPLVTQQKFHDL